PHLAVLVGLAVAGLGRAGEGFARRHPGHPVRRLGPGPPRHQPGAVLALVDIDDVAGHVLADHVPGRLRPAAQAAQAQAAALAEGVVPAAGVFAQDLAAHVADLARLRRDPAREEFAEVPLADEADAGGVLLGRRRQAGLGGQAADLGLGQVA